MKLKPRHCLRQCGVPCGFVLLLVTTAAAGTSNDGVKNVQQVPSQVITSRTANTTFFVTPDVPSLGQPTVTWEASPSCTTQPTPYNSVADYYGRRWGLTENSAASSANTAGASCAFKDESGSPIFSWETAPRCLVAPSVLTAIADSQGRLWGVEPGPSHSCAFKAADSDRPLYDFLTAPPCSAAPEPVTSECDSLGRLWGWELGHECAYKATDNNPLKLPPGFGNLTNVQSVSPEEMVARGAVLTAPSLTWRASPACVAPPSKYNSLMDSRGRLWGWERNVSCAFKGADAAPVYDWITAPRCLGDVTEGSNIDSAGRLWGFEAGSSCAFKDLQQQPLRIWVTAMRCPIAPSLDIAVPDAQGRLWGWFRTSNSSAGASCAYRDDKGNALTFSTPTSPAFPLPPAPQPQKLPDAGAARRSVGSPSPVPRLSTSPANISVNGRRREALGGMRRSRNSVVSTGRMRPSHTDTAAAGDGARLNHVGALTPSDRYTQDQMHRHRRLMDSSSSFPSCRNWPAPANARPDSYGRYWSSEGGRSCVYRDSSGNIATLWDIVPTCSSQASGQLIGGRSWGWENGRTCAGRGSSSSSSSSTASFDTSDLWNTAPACSANPTTSNSKADWKGRLWGWENSMSCAFKGAEGTVESFSVTISASGSTSKAPKDYATGDIHKAPSCSGTPTMETSQPDDVGYLWGWQDGRACVFRGSNGKVLYYAALITGDWSAQPGYVPKATSKSGWFDAPRCSQPPTWDAKPDSEGRLWGYENGRGCVFRDARGYPLFYSDLQSGNVAEYYNKGSVWDNSPACPDSPSWSTARADNYGRLWGWNSASGTGCAYKNSSGQPIFPPR